MTQGFWEVLREQKEVISADAKVYWSKRPSHSALSSVLYVVTCHGWHIMLWFRLGKITYAIPIPVLSHLLKILFQLQWFLLTTVYGIWIDASCKIGKGFYIGHFGGIIINGQFGEYCSVGQGVTVGSKGAGKSDGWPVIGDNVYIGAGAKIIGSISIGNGSIVGANSVVLNDVPTRTLAVGVPVKLKPLS